MDILDLLSFIYLYLPVDIFFITWLKPIFSIPLIAITLILLFSFNPHSTHIKLSPRLVIILVLVTVAISYWCMSAGLGGFTAQSADWPKHNVLLLDLINKSWPVHYTLGAHHGILSYYIGFYIIPAMMGKLFGFNFAQDIMLIWATIGIILTILQLYRYIGNVHPSRMIAIFFGIIMFGTFLYVLYGLFKVWAPQDASAVVGEWFSSKVTAQYTSVSTQLKVVFPQTIPAMLGTALLVDKLNRPEYWGQVCAPLVLYSIFSFLGLVLLICLTACIQLTMFFIRHRNTLLKKYLSSLFNYRNIFAIIISIGLFLYIGCNLFQPKPSAAMLSFTLTPWAKYPIDYIVMQASWLIWAGVLIHHNKNNLLLLSADIILLILPSFSYGAFNDFCMRVSIPALFVLNFLVIKDLILYWKKDHFYSAIILLFLILTGLGPIGGQYRQSPLPALISHKRYYNMPFKSGKSFFSSSIPVKYQYVDWHANSGLAKKIIR